MRTLRDRALIEEFQHHEATRRAAPRKFAPRNSTATDGTTAASSTGSDGNGGAGDGTQGGSGDATVAAGALPVGMGWDASDHMAAARAALVEVGGLGFIQRGDAVYLKVNTNSGDPYPYSTSPDLLLLVGGMLRDLGVTDLRIGDRSFWGDDDTAGNFARNGIADAARQLGTSALVFDDDTTDWLELPSETLGHWQGTVRLPTPVTTAAHILNLACLKTHFIATFSMSLKNCLGIVHPIDRARDGNLRVHDTAILYQQIAEIAGAFTPSLNIVDGYQALITGGPTPSSGASPTFGAPRVVIAGADRVAVDVTGIAVLQTLSPPSEAVTSTAPFANPQIVAAAAAGLGIDAPARYVLKGPTVPAPSLADYLRRATAA